MGYTHYWYREREINRDAFAKIVRDFRKLLPILKVLDVKLGDGRGEGNPIINNKEVIFNGLRNCGHPKNSHIVIPWPAEIVKPGVAPNASQAVVGSWFAGVLLNQRTCDGDCSYETFYFPRFLPQTYKPIEPVTCYDLSGRPFCSDRQLVGKYFDCCKTAFRPYDLAVTAFLVTVKHHLVDGIIVRSDGELVQWMDAMRLCHESLGYGLDFQLRERSIEKASYA
jgi:hypothetical protein